MSVWGTKWDNCFRRDATAVVIGVAIYNVLCILSSLVHLEFEVFRKVKMFVFVFTVPSCPRHDFQRIVLGRTRPLLGPLEYSTLS